MIKMFPFEIENTSDKKVKVVKFDKSNVKMLLDWLIDNWKKKLKKAKDNNDSFNMYIALCYIDAFMLVKSYLFGTKTISKNSNLLNNLIDKF